MDETDPLPDASDFYPDLADMDPRQAEKISRLRGLLKELRWDRSRACTILSGFHPDVSMGPGIAQKALLPGVLRHFGYPESHVVMGDENELEDAFRDLAERVAALSLEIYSSPRDAIAAADKACIDIPWLNFAQEDAICRLTLPRGLRPTETDDFRSEKTLLKKFPDWVEQIHEAYRLHALGYTFNKISDEMSEKFPEVSTGLRGWIRRFKNGETAADVTRQAMKYRDSLR